MCHKPDMQNFSNLAQGNNFKFRVEWRRGRKNRPYLGNAERYGQGYY